MQNIGDFAEQLILNQVGNIKEGREVLPSNKENGLAPAGKDISNIEVPDSFMKEILGESFHPQDTPAVDSIPEIVWDEPEEAKAPQSLTEETAQQLVPLLEEVRDLLKEMGTTAGMMGVNLAGPKMDQESYAKMEKSYGYQATKKPNLPNNNTRKSVLKNSIKSKLKRRK